MTRSRTLSRRRRRLLLVCASALLVAAAVPSVAAGTPTYAGGASAGWGYQEGDVLVANPGTWTSTAAISYTYAWFNENSVALGTGPTYTVAGSDVGHQIYAAITASDGTPPSLTVNTQTVGPMRYRPPVDTVKPSVAGAFLQGSTLVASAGTWVSGGASKAPIRIDYAWYRGCTVDPKPDCSNTGTIGTASTLTLSAADLGRLISLSVSASYPDGFGGDAIGSSWVGGLGPVVGSSIAAGEALTGTVQWTVTVPGVQTIAFLANGTELAVRAPDESGRATIDLDTTSLPNGANSLAVTVAWKDGTSTVQVGPVVVANATPPPPASVKPLIAKPTTAPARPVVGRRLLVTFAVTRSDNHRALTGGRMTSEPSLNGRVIPHTESFANGKARVAFVVPKGARHRLLTVRLVIRLGGESATRVATFRIA